MEYYEGSTDIINNFALSIKKIDYLTCSYMHKSNFKKIISVFIRAMKSCIFCYESKKCYCHREFLRDLNLINFEISSNQEKENIWI